MGGSWSVRALFVLVYGASQWSAAATTRSVRPLGSCPAPPHTLTIDGYGAIPGSLPFLPAVAGLTVPAAAGALVAARRRRATSVRPTSEPVT
jgi:hypothetical protein